MGQKVQMRLRPTNHSFQYIRTDPWCSRIEISNANMKLSVLFDRFKGDTSSNEYLETSFRGSGGRALLQIFIHRKFCKIHGFWVGYEHTTSWFPDSCSADYNRIMILRSIIRWPGSMDMSLYWLPISNSSWRVRLYADRRSVWACMRGYSVLLCLPLSVQPRRTDQYLMYIGLQYRVHVNYTVL